VLQLLYTLVADNSWALTLELRGGPDGPSAWTNCYACRDAKDNARYQPQPRCGDDDKHLGLKMRLQEQTQEWQESAG